MFNFEYLGKEGATFGNFAVRVNGKIAFGKYESHPNSLVYINGASLIQLENNQMEFSFNGAIRFRDGYIEEHLQILRESHAAIFKGGAQ